MLLCVCAAGTLHADEERPARPPVLRGSELYRLLERTSVEILVDDHLAGSGAFVDAGGIVLTAAHVLGKPGARIEVLTNGAGRLDAQRVAVDLGHDLALIRVPARGGGYRSLAVAPRTPPAGAPIFLFGAPIYRHAVMLPGRVARGSPTFECYPNLGRYGEIVHVAADTPQGTSGGPWVDRFGRVVGVQSGLMVTGKASAGIAYMAPVPAIALLLETRRSAATPSIGIAVEETWQQQPDTLERYPPRTEGLVVRVLYEGSTAAEAGVRQWDVIQAVDETPVRLPDEFFYAVRGKKFPGQVALTLLAPDDAGSRTVTVPLARLEAAWEGQLDVD